jgi:protein-tyrosine phosphatase
LGGRYGYPKMADDPDPLALFKRPVPIDDDERLWLSANYHDWTAVVQEHGLSVVIDLEQDLDRGIPDHPDSVIYVYFPIRDEGLPPLRRLHAVAQLGSDLLRQGERLLVHCEMGLNRSALLAGLILVHGGTSGEAAFERLQIRRPGALFNRHFSEYLRRQPRGGQLLGTGDLGTGD